MSGALNLFVPLAAFVAAGGVVFTALTWYRPMLTREAAQQEAEIRRSLNALYIGEEHAVLWVRVRFFGVPLLAVVVFLLTQSFLFGLVSGGILFILPPMLLQQAEARRLERLQAQVVDLINSLVATAKSGMNLHQSLQDVSDRLAPPISQECAVLLRRIESGQSMEAALLEADARLQVPNLSLVFQSLVVNERRGGKLPALLERIAVSLREIERVEERVKTETSGIRLSSKLMAAMPLVVCFLVYLASPEHVLMLFDSLIGNLILIVALIFDYLGFTMIRRLSELEV